MSTDRFDGGSFPAGAGDSLFGRHDAFRGGLAAAGCQWGAPVAMPAVRGSASLKLADSRFPITFQTGRSNIVCKQSPGTSTEECE